jgi:hypothetical protein
MDKEAIRYNIINIIGYPIWNRPVRFQTLATRVMVHCFLKLFLSVQRNNLQKNRPYYAISCLSQVHQEELGGPTHGLDMLLP